MKALLSAPLLALLLAGCGPNAETSLAQCRMDPAAEKAGIWTCMRAKNFELHIEREWCSPKDAQHADALPAHCYEHRGAWFHTRRFFGVP